MFLTLKKLITYLTGNTMRLYYKDDLVSFASGQNGWCFRSSGTWRRVERIRTFQECLWGRFLGRLFLESLALKMRILWNVRSSSANITCRKTWMVRRPQIWHPFVTVFWSSPYQHLTHSQLTAHWPHRWALHCAPLLLSTGMDVHSSNLRPWTNHLTEACPRSCYEPTVVFQLTSRVLPYKSFFIQFIIQ